MSAYIVDEDTIDLLVTVAMFGGEWRKGIRVRGQHYETVLDGNTLGAVLIAENVRSVNYRYGENDTPGSYEWKPAGIAKYLGGAIGWGDVLGALDCYEYQACETPDWHETLAYDVCQAIRRKVCGILSADCWEWSRETLQRKLDADRAAILADIRGVS